MSSHEHSVTTRHAFTPVREGAWNTISEYTVKVWIYETPLVVTTEPRTFLDEDGESVTVDFEIPDWDSSTELGSNTMTWPCPVAQQTNAVEGSNEYRKKYGAAKALIRVDADYKTMIRTLLATTHE